MATTITPQNGRLPASALTATRTGQPLRHAAAASYARLDAAMRAAGQGALTLTPGLSGYRTLADQQHLRNIGLTTIAVGRSAHGEGLAADFQGLGGMSGARFRWLRTNGLRFGWFHPAWATPGSPHHWEYDQRRDTHAGGPTAPPATPEPEPEPDPWEDTMPWFIRRRDGAIVIVSGGVVRPVTAVQWDVFTNLGMARFPPGMDNMDPGPFDEVVRALGGIVG